jgi:hypothetical protein
MALAQGIVGVQRNFDGTTPITQRFGQQGDGMISELHGRYYEQTVRGNMFNGATQALVTTTVGLALTYTGLVLSNPISSPVNLVITTASMMQSVIQSAQIEAFALAVGFNVATNVTHTSAVTPRASLIGSSATPNGLTDVSATLPTAPFYHTFLTNTGTATANSTGPLYFDIAGRIVLKPGAYCLFVTPAQASVAGMWFGFDWEEVPVVS